MGEQDANQAVEEVLKQLLGAPSTSALVKALGQTGQGEAFDCIRAIARRAGERAIDKAIADGKGEEMFASLEKYLDSKPAPAAMTGVLHLAGHVAGHLEKASVKRLLERCGALFDSESAELGTAAGVALGKALRVAIGKGTYAPSEQPTTLLTTSLDTMAKANSAAESRTAARGLGAAVGALGEGALIEHSVVSKVKEAMSTKSKTAAFARESATLALGELCVQLREKFEPYAIPLLSSLVQMMTDKEKRVADAATLSARALLEGLSTLSVKSVIDALYEGLKVVGGGGRTRIECLSLCSLLAKRAPRTMGPCLPECIPLVMECLHDSNAKVQKAAEDSLPELCSCVENAEVASTLKGHLMLALKKPDTTLACIDEVLMTTFCNPMDGTSLAFMMPIVIRGIKDANYELVKKATTCTSNLCALIKDSSDIAPFVPLLLPMLEKNLEHSSPDIRTVSTAAKEKLLEGAGDLVDPAKRRNKVAAVLVASLKATLGAKVPAEVVTYLGATSASMLEERLGGVVRVSYFTEAPTRCANWLADNLAGLVQDDGLVEACATAASEAVQAFHAELSEAAKGILAESGDKDFALDIQNIILAFAGRVLLRKADIRFERGHRYGLVGQNGTGKTTLLNRLAAKDINGFPQELKVWYIRHETICDDGISVEQHLESLAPKDGGRTVASVLDEIHFPHDLRTGDVNALSGGWKMKLSVALSILHEPELLLLDEPTNHLDRDAIDWLTKHILSLEGVTIAVVSHDYDFIDEVCTDIVHYDNGGNLGKPCHFVYYHMTFKGFQTLKPEIAAGLPRVEKGVATAAGVVDENRTPSEASEASDSESSKGMSRSASSNSLASETSSDGGSSMSATLSKIDDMIAQGLVLPMFFPDPGKPDGIRTFRKPIMTLKDVTFAYPGTERKILDNVSASLTLGSRAVIIGGNGCGKSTFLQLLIGDLEANQGDHWKHHALRLSYVAQQAMHHVEEYLTVTPIHYIQERFRTGLDKEVGKLKTLALTEEEQKMTTELGNVCEVVGRTVKGKNVWYEVRKQGRAGPEADTKSYPFSEVQSLFKPYVQKLIKNFDQKQQAIESGMAVRPITAAEVLKHLADFGIDSQLAHGKIRQMSGGQRQRLVICAAFWSKPHVIALDEPTNYLDNDSVAALTKALKDFKGAVVTVSENEAFVAEISNEKWVVEDGKVTTVQLRDAKAR